MKQSGFVPRTGDAWSLELSFPAAHERKPEREPRARNLRFGPTRNFEFESWVPGAPPVISIFFELHEEL